MKAILQPSIRALFSVSLGLALALFSCKKEGGDDLDPDGGGDPEIEIVEKDPAVQTAMAATISSNCGGYYKALPARYDSTSIKYPLLIFLHGLGELGNGTSDLPKVLKNAIPKLINNKKFPPNFKVGGKNFSFIVVTPQFKDWPKSTDIDAVIQHAVSNLRIDESRIYVSGLSMGGGMTWEYGAFAASKIAAIAPICGASWPEKTRAQAIAKANLPVWAFHNEDDGTCPVSYSKDYVKQINEYAPVPNPKALLTLWPTGGHDAWTKATDPSFKQNDLNIYEWMLQYKR